MDGHLRQMGYEASRAASASCRSSAATAVLRRSAAARKALVASRSASHPRSMPTCSRNTSPRWWLPARRAGAWTATCCARLPARGINRRGDRRLGQPQQLPPARRAGRLCNCWSEIQKQELVLGSDWSPERVNIGGIPSYDGYFRKDWLMPREEYFALHGLDPKRKLLAYACSFVTFSPNYANIDALAELVNSDSLREPCQLFIRLHPNHFMPGSLYEGEANRVRALIKDMPHVHLVEPVPLGGGLGYYSGEDMPEKASMMAYSDVFLTVYSTMVVETAIHDRPIVSVCIDVPGGWNTPGKFSLPLAEIGEWPTHQRFREAGAGRVAFSAEQARDAVNFYLEHPHADEEARLSFLQREVTFTDGSAGQRTGEYLASLVGK